MDNLFKKIIISLVLAFVILFGFLIIIGPILVRSGNDDSASIILTASLHFTMILCTLVILDNNKKNNKCLFF